MKSAASGHDGLFKRGLALLLFPLVHAILSGWPVVPLSGLWILLGGMRLWYQDQTVLQDCLLFSVCGILLSLRGFLQASWWAWQAPAENKVLGQVTCAILAASALLAFCMPKSPKLEPDQVPPGAHAWTLPHPQPLLFPCRTTHARMFPNKHSFGYNYLLCGFPIIPSSTTSDGHDIANGRDKILGSWWLQIRAKDYLGRGQGELGFYGKLKAYLRDQGIGESDWSYAYLVTAPRFFGYSFNPASFWYIYNRDHELKKMITEVNNTFGERRLYLLHGSGPSTPVRTPDSEAPTPDPWKLKFSDMWVKDFHVSPFNSRKGTYTMKALNPFPTPSFSSPSIDNTIVLKSSKDHGKIVARLYSTGGPIALTQIGWIQTLGFISGWWWVGFLTFPRILREAYTLYFQRSLHVWFKPEVLSSGIGRLPSTTETFLHTVFQDYLTYLVNQSPDAPRVFYETAVPEAPRRVIAATHQQGRAVGSKDLEIKITTGAFYSRFMHYAYTSEGFDRECLFTDEKNRTLWISKPELLPLILRKSIAGKLEAEEGFVERSYMDELRWTVMRKLRCPPVEPPYPITPKSVRFEIDDIRSLPFSELDRFVRGVGGRDYAGCYRRIVTELFLAQRYALGFPEVIDMLDLSLRMALCWMAAWILGRHTQRADASVGGAMDGQWWLTAASLCSCHAYGLVKGYR